MLKKKKKKIKKKKKKNLQLLRSESMVNLALNFRCLPSANMFLPDVEDCSTA